MPYTAPVNRQTPGAILFLIDQSGSMDEILQPRGTPTRLDEPQTVDGITYTHTVDGVTKAECLADAVNRAIFDLVTHCTRHDGCRHYFDVGVIGYRSRRVGSCLRAGLSERVLQPLPLFEHHTLRVEERAPRRKGGTAEVLPIWIEPQAEGDTPMCRALELAADALAQWCEQHPTSHPPIVINVTDGQSSDGDPEGPCEHIKRIGTNDGACLIFNLFLEPGRQDPILFPVREQDLPTPHARSMFRMSSAFPDTMRLQAAERGHPIPEGGRMFGYKAGIVTLLKCFDMATRAAQLR
jgi:hypothetical protein